MEYEGVYYLNNFNGRTVVKAELGKECGLLDIENKTLLPFIFNDVKIDRDNYYSVDYYDGSGHGDEKGIIQLIDMPLLQGGVFVNNKRIDFSVPPLLINNRTMIPVREVFEKIGYAVDWDGENETVNITGNNSLIQIFQDKNGFTKDGSYIYSDMPSINIEDRIYLPLRAITEAIGCNIAYDDATGNVMIEY